MITDQTELDARIDGYGPFPVTRRKIVLFSTGNDWEDHGPAMAAASDTYFAQTFCAGAAVRTGVRYLAHAPFTSDGAGDCARAWCPVYLPEPEYFERTTEFCKAVLDRTDPRPEAVVIFVPNHGEPEMARRIEEFGSRLEVKARLVGDIVTHKRLTVEDYEDSPLRSLVEEGIEGDHFQHCGFFDYSVAWALGHLDKPRLDALREEMERDLEAALKRYPTIHNLAGYVRYGGSEFAGLREVLGVPEGEPYPKVEPKWQDACLITGKGIVEDTIDILTEEILDFEREVFG